MLIRLFFVFIIVQFPMMQKIHIDWLQSPLLEGHSGSTKIGKKYLMTKEFNRLVNCFF